MLRNRFVVCDLDFYVLLVSITLTNFIHVSVGLIQQMRILVYTELLE